MTRMENWSTRAGHWDPYTAPEAISQVLYGQVYGHPAFLDGKVVTTSRLIRIDIANRKAFTKSREYDLGEIDADYLQFCKTKSSADVVTALQEGGYIN